MSNLAPAINNRPYFQTIIPIEKFGANELAKAKEVFIEYKVKGIIVDSEFEGNRWQFCDEYKNLGIKFVEPGFMYTRRYEGIFGVSGEEMLVWIKVFAVFRLGQNVLESICDFVHDANDLFNIAPEKIKDKEFRTTNILMEFIEILPVIDEEAADYIMDRLELCAEKKNQSSASHQRQLASFLSYFLFEELLNTFWNGCIDIAERLFFYPVFLWWVITAILPLRPREFILTPRNCIRELEGKYYLTIRRDNLKGSGRKVHYNIKEDYKLEEYEIPKSLYVLIKGYIDLTNEYEDNVTNTLFRAEPHYKRFNHVKPYTSRFYTYVNLVCALRIFGCNLQRFHT